MTIRFLRYAPISAMALACSAQVGPDYQGEALLTLQGQVVAANATTRPAEAAMVWISVRPPYFSYLGTSVAVSGEFPMGFQLKVFTPPPQRALAPVVPIPPDQWETFDPNRIPSIGAARVVALAAGADRTAVELSDIVGMSTDGGIFYNSLAIDPASIAGQTFAKQGVPLGAGYHLVSLPPLPTESEYWARVRCATGGVCRKIHSGPETPTVQTAISAREYDDCLTATPGATTCEQWVAPSTPEELEQSVDCDELVRAHQGTSCVPAEDMVVHELQPGESLTVTMGRSPLDRWQ